MIGERLDLVVDYVTYVFVPALALVRAGFLEGMVGLVNGFLFAIIMGVIAGVWFSEAMLGVVIGVAMITNLVVAGLAGALIPLFMDRRGIDPAVASTVILTTVTDVVGFFTFLGLATLILL